MKQQQRLLFVGGHVLCLIAAAFFPLYVRVAKWITRVIPGCIIHDLLFLYCPLCGGTRALSALLHLDLPEALAANAFVVLVAAVALFFDARAWIRFFRGREQLWSIPAWVWISAAVLMVIYGIGRNLLMIFCSLDPLGDLLPIWNRIRA